MKADRVRSEAVSKVEEELRKKESQLDQFRASVKDFKASSGSVSEGAKVQQVGGHLSLNPPLTRSHSLRICGLTVLASFVVSRGQPLSPAALRVCNANMCTPFLQNTLEEKTRQYEAERQRRERLEVQHRREQQLMVRTAHFSRDCAFFCLAM